MANVPILYLLKTSKNLYLLITLLSSFQKIVRIATSMNIAVVDSFV